MKYELRNHKAERFDNSRVSMDDVDISLIVDALLCHGTTSHGLSTQDRDRAEELARAIAALHS